MPCKFAFGDNFHGIGITHGFDLPKHKFFQFNYKRYNRFNAYHLLVNEIIIPTNPIGGNKYDGEYTVPVVVKETNTEVYVDYHNGDKPTIYYRTYEAARNAALKWLGNRKEVTQEQLKEVEQKELNKRLAEKLEHLAWLENAVQITKEEIEQIKNQP